MKSGIFLLFTPLILILSSWGFTSKKPSNINTWSVSIGKKEVLSYKKNEIGDTVVVSLKSIKTTDSLFAHRYLCGYGGKPWETTITIKDQNGNAIAKTTNKNKSIGYSASLLMKNIIDSDQFKKETCYKIYFLIYSPEEDLNHTVVLGHLKFK